MRTTYIHYYPELEPKHRLCMHVLLMKLIRRHTQVTAFNYAELRDAVIRGPKGHPGANAIEDEMGNKIILKESDPQSRLALSKTLRVGGPTGM
jgi:hypothetical protein